MAYSLAPASMLCTLNLPLMKTSIARRPLQVTSAQRYNDEGKGPSKNNIVDANLHVLMMRIKDAKNKERQLLQQEVSLGWNYASDHDDVGSSFRAKMEKEFMEFVGIVASTLGLTILTSTVVLYIISFIILHS